MAYEHTFIHKNGMKQRKLTAMSAIKEKCMECGGWSYKELKLCPATDCALWPFRFGRNPKKGDLTLPKNGAE